MSAEPTPADRVLPYTRVLSLCIVPFLIAGFVILYLFPQHTPRLWAWPLRPTMTSMVLASAYLGGAYFFIRAALERQWHVLAPGLLSVTLFATLLGVATVLHWDKFSHDNPAFWIWSALYFVAPFLVLGSWLANRRYDVPTGDDALPPIVRGVIAGIGLLALAQGTVMFISPTTFLDLWPWPLTPLSGRTLAAVSCLGGAGLWAVHDARWSTLRRMLEVEMIMVGSILVAALRAREQLDSSKALAWPLLIGFSLLFFASIALWARHGLRARGTLAPIG
ncbi:hypothetical protein F1D05_36960 [Kribbella qitaiheensis]|uniref:Uncharacterized protein n=1 Tax=Kribbella qitaiheensis TaxID=1544730 RepID=A0A7G6X8B1_9ACTN|nr:hypothetical protein [Kribbella qitaiheensis]QNE22476.1 hypothetical protein F1D05_36960 [Kribbella qitaiheensis]